MVPIVVGQLWMHLTIKYLDLKLNKHRIITIELIQ
jgi:hypothetical protein